MRPYYEDEQILIIQLKGPTSLDEIQSALVSFLGDPVAHPQQRFMLELQYATMSFNMDEASEFFLRLEAGLEVLQGRRLVVVISESEMQRPPTARLVEKVATSTDASQQVAFVADLGAAHEVFNAMDAND